MPQVNVSPVIRDAWVVLVVCLVTVSLVKMDSSISLVFVSHHAPTEQCQSKETPVVARVTA
jgi:hypothetical protein